MNKSKLYLVISWIFVIFWMMMIFNFSAVSGEKSAKSSIGIISKTVEVTSNLLYKVRIIKKPLTKNEIKKITDKLNYPVRKFMHISEYFILTLLLYNALALSKVRKIFLLSLLISILYSISDEFHQLFTARTGSIIDVLIDMVGMFLALCLLLKINNKLEKY